MLEIYNDAVLTSAATFDLVPIDIGTRKKWFDEHDMHYPLVTAESHGVVAGYCCISPYSKKTGYSKTVELSVYVHRRYREQGIGTALVKDMIMRARRLGYHAIVSSISGSNYESEKLHRKLGFELRGYMKHLGYKFGEWQDVALYELIL
jgi:L-amino acid N-acyltransferase YncA